MLLTYKSNILEIMEIPWLISLFQPLVNGINRKKCLSLHLLVFISLIKSLRIIPKLIRMICKVLKVTFLLFSQISKLIICRDDDASTSYGANDAKTYCLIKTQKFHGWNGRHGRYDGRHGTTNDGTNTTNAGTLKVKNLRSCSFPANYDANDGRNAMKSYYNFIT